MIKKKKKQCSTQGCHLAASWEARLNKSGLLGNCLTTKTLTQETKINLVPYWFLGGKSWHPEIAFF